MRLPVVPRMLLFVIVLLAPAWLRAGDPRRTVAVEIFQQWQESVIYLTGPMVAAGEPPTEEFFRLPKHNERTNIGSGFVIHADGYIVANAHAMDRVISPQVVLSDGKKFAAELIGLARNQDLALLKIDAGRPLKPVQLAKAGDVLIGEPVVVIANPHGLLSTCTSGIVSAIDRSTQPSGLPGVVLHELIQTDASINPGSSGGPWFNALGQVLGITASRKADSENIAFAVPAATLRRVLPDLLDVERRYGVATGLEISIRDPGRVAKVLPGSPAAAAGVLPDDVLAKLDGRPIADRFEFCFALVGRKPRDVLKFVALRGDKPVETSLTLAVRPKPDGAAVLKTKFHLVAVPLDEAKAKATWLRVSQGVVITEVLPGLYDKVKDPPLPGDVLARINGIRPRDLDHVGLLLEEVKPGDTAALVLLRRRDNVVTRVDLNVVTGH